jgi:hypothetical protein
LSQNLRSLRQRLFWARLYCRWRERAEPKQTFAREPSTQAVNRALRLRYLDGSGIHCMGLQAAI